MIIIIVKSGKNINPYLDVGFEKYRFFIGNINFSLIVMQGLNKC
jgi:hypothetical protein